MDIVNGLNSKICQPINTLSMESSKKIKVVICSHHGIVG